jgi:hypothetical protein
MSKLRNSSAAAREGWSKAEVVARALKKREQSSRTPKRMITRSVSYSDWLWASRNKTSARRGPGLKPGLYGRLRAERSGLGRLGLRTLAGRILRLAALPARWQARHMYQLAMVR